MKYFLVISVALASSQVFAQGAIFSTDYSLCQQAVGAFGAQINHKGELEAGPGQLASPDVKTVELANGDKQISYTFKSQMLGMNGKPMESKYKINKAKNGDLTEVSTVQEKVDAQTISMYKKMSLNSAVYSGLSFDTFIEPTVQLGNGIFAALSNLSTKEAKLFGVDIDELKALKKQKRKDKKSLMKITEGYSKLLEKSNIMIPNGSEVKMEIKDGVCKATSINQMAYNTKTKTNHVISSINEARCAEVIKVQKKYQQRLDACSNLQVEMSREMNPQGGFTGGIAGGYNGGMGAGGPGYPVSGYGGYPVGGYGYGFNSESMQCQMYYGEFQQGGWGGYGGGMVGGPSSGSGLGFGVGQ